MIMLVAESRMVMGKAHVFHVGSLSNFSESNERTSEVRKRDKIIYFIKSKF